MGEILTLQFGHYANFVGTHFWNIQEHSFDYTSASEINHDALYREGLNHKNQVTFTPRLLLVDLKGSLNSLPERGTLYGADSIDSYEAWPEDLVSVERSEAAIGSSFVADVEHSGKSLQSDYDLDENVKVWSDYLYARFHPRSVNVIKEYEMRNENTTFDGFIAGKNLWKTLQFEEDFNDRIRRYVEECDKFQGFHVILDAYDGFSGLASSCIESLADDFSGKSVLALPVLPAYYEQNTALHDSVRVVNLALCFDSLFSQSSLVVPLSTGSQGWRQPGVARQFYHVSYKENLPYHTGAILASALDTFSLKYRLKTSNIDLNDLCTDMSTRKRKIAAASVCLPFSINEDADLIECLDNWDGPLSQSLTPRCSISNEKVMQHITLRGIEELKLKRPPAQAKSQKNLPAYKCETVQEMLTFYLSCTTYATASNVTVFDKPLSVKTPYPQIFDSFVGVEGNICAKKREQNEGVVSVPVLSGLHNGAAVGDMIESLHTESAKIKIARLRQFLDLERDEFGECLDRLFELRECYEDKYYT